MFWRYLCYLLEYTPKAPLSHRWIDYTCDRVIFMLWDDTKKQKSFHGRLHSSSDLFIYFLFFPPQRVDADEKHETEHRPLNDTLRHCHKWASFGRTGKQQT